MPEKRASYRSRNRRPGLLSRARRPGAFYALALSQKKVRLLACDADGYTVLPLDEKTPTSRRQAERFLEQGREFQGRGIPSGKARSQAVDHGGGREDAKLRVREFIEEVDDGVQRRLRREKAPLVLATVRYEADLYREVSDYPYLVDEVVEGNPDLMSDRELHARAIAVMKRRLREVRSGRKEPAFAD